jgi:hypothetical protein
MAADKTIAADRHQAVNTETVSSVHSMGGWFALKHDPRIHIKTRLPKELQSAEINPKVKPPCGQLRSFQSSIDNHLRPGAEYYTGGVPVRAVAGGIVHFVGQLPAGTGDNGRFYLRVAHDFYDDLEKPYYPRVTLYRNQAYRSSYYYLAKVVVEHWQSVKRGQILGYGSKYGRDDMEKVKIVLEERGNWVNPDGYGRNHGFMDYWDRETDLEIVLEEMNHRLDSQIAIVRELYGYYTKRSSDKLFDKLHTVIDTEKYKNYPVKWSTSDRFRYLANLYKKDPDLFPGLSSAEFETMNKYFYANQPIILTLPFQ